MRPANIVRWLWITIVFGHGGLSSIQVSAPAIQQTAPGARIVVSGGTVVEKRTGKPDQPLVLKNHDFMSMAVEERSIENTGNSPVELVEIELK